MQSKPDFLGTQFATRFQNQNVVDRYHLRPTYPPETFRILADLITDEPRVLLDAGCGTGDVARYMLAFVERIDAVDISLPMMERGKTLPFDLIGELEKRRLFQKKGEVCTAPVPFEQSVQNHIEAFHSQSSLSQDHMAPEMAAAFDEEMRELLNSHAQDGTVSVQVFGHIVWGRPQEATI